MKNERAGHTFAMTLVFYVVLICGCFFGSSTHAFAQFPSGDAVKRIQGYIDEIEKFQTDGNKVYLWRLPNFPGNPAQDTLKRAFQKIGMEYEGDPYDGCAITCISDFWRESTSEKSAASIRNLTNSIRILRTSSLVSPTGIAYLDELSGAMREWRGSRDKFLRYMEQIAPLSAQYFNLLKKQQEQRGLANAAKSDADAVPYRAAEASFAAQKDGVYSDRERVYADAKKILPAILPSLNEKVVILDVKLDLQPPPSNDGVYPYAIREGTKVTLELIIENIGTDTAENVMVTVSITGSGGVVEGESTEFLLEKTSLPPECKTSDSSIHCRLQDLPRGAVKKISLKGTVTMDGELYAKGVVMRDNDKYGIFTSFSKKVRSVPVITRHTPFGAIASKADTPLTITGNGFLPYSKLKWDCFSQARSLDRSVELPVKFISRKNLEAIVPITLILDPGDCRFLVENPEYGASPSLEFRSNEVRFPVNRNPDPKNPRPTITFVEAKLDKDWGVILRIQGTEFFYGSEVYVNGQNVNIQRASFGYSSPRFDPIKTLTIIIRKEDLPQGNLNIKVVNPLPGGGSSAVVRVIPVPN